MGLSILIVSAYFVVGLFLVFVGPAARQRQIETEELQWQATTDDSAARPWSNVAAGQDNDFKVEN
jgi:hypothetical protein